MTKLTKFIHKAIFGERKETPFADKCSNCSDANCYQGECKKKKAKKVRK